MASEDHQDTNGTDAEPCLFCSIAAGEIPARIVHEEEEILAFRDVNPQAPRHILLIPREHVTSVAALEPAHQEMAGRLLLAAREVAVAQGLEESGYRLVLNHGSDGGQTVHHLHLHLLGGRRMSWPPG
jgi:histidine triad (HIT) family protein